MQPHMTERPMTHTHPTLLNAAATCMMARRAHSTTCPTPTHAQCAEHPRRGRRLVRGSCGQAQAVVSVSGCAGTSYPATNRLTALPAVVCHPIKGLAAWLAAQCLLLNRSRLTRLACCLPVPHPHRFRGYLGSRRSNDNKTMSLRRDELREQLEAAGESVGEDVTFLAVTAASAAVFLVSPEFEELCCQATQHCNELFWSRMCNSQTTELSGLLLPSCRALSTTSPPSPAKHADYTIANLWSSM
jgi:hypothetical protein